MIRTPTFWPLALAFLWPGVAAAAVISGEEVHLQYDYGEFYAVASNQEFKVVVRGNPTALPQAEFEGRLMPILDRNIAVVRTSFTTTPKTTDKHPDYRLVLVFNTSSGLMGQTICKHDQTIDAPAAPAGRVTVAAAYCRNDQPMSEAFARTDAASMDDPAFNRLFAELLAVLFPPNYGPPADPRRMRRHMF